MATIELRPAMPADRVLLFEVYASTRVEELAVVPWDDAQKDVFLRLQFDAQDRAYRGAMPDATFDVIVVDGVDAGRLYVDRREIELRVVDIALLPVWRGMGVGTALLRTLLDEADASGVPATVHVLVLNDPARALYERLGFEQVSVDGAYALLSRAVASGVVAAGMDNGIDVRGTEC